MRLISQDGSIDIPYENFVFSITRDNYIIATRDMIASPSEIVHGVVAKYSTKENAMKVMQLIQNQYLDFCCNYHAQSGVFCFPKDEEVEV